MAESAARLLQSTTDPGGAFLHQGSPKVGLDKNLSELKEQSSFKVGTKPWSPDAQYKFRALVVAMGTHPGYTSSPQGPRKAIFYWVYGAKARVGGSIPSLGTTFRFQVMPSTPDV
ncbi:hypothetical protein, partial [Pseudomonas viridiflava]|uniref:hypothetical protein n=1 Tax=Pseudomonas viridiflava TaxID=33069 RepID=UPI0019D2042C